MKKRAVILMRGTKYNICCDIDFLPDFMEYVFRDPAHSKEIKMIFQHILESMGSKKYSNEPYGTKAMKPFKNRENDRILCNVTKRQGKKQCIVMAEIFEHKKSQRNDKVLDNRYKIISKYEYEIIE